MGALENLEITVMSKTADTLKKMAAESEITIGEVVDRVTMKMSTSDPELATMLISQEMMMILSQLSEEDSQKVYTDLAFSIMATCPPEALDEIVSEVKLRRQIGIEKFDAMSDEERAELVESIRNFSGPTA